ncbi:hypothetical protein LCGC14_1886300 [marine sediment metagenome]|uniref:Uncharacterized protein n=1 Tax=marine sediment metagenome TaxID=412755 RepID=A0A0F9G0U8_9ZZZZ
MTDATTDRIVAALIEAGASKKLIKKARRGGFRPSEDVDMPIPNLVKACNKEMLFDLALRAQRGEFGPMGGYRALTAADYPWTNGWCFVPARKEPA